MLKQLWLGVRSLAMLALFPGTVTLLIPYLLLQPLLLLPPADWTVYQYPAAVLFGAGALLLLSSAWTFAWVGRGSLAPFDETNVLIIAGPYRYVRNPMYVGVVLMLFAEAWFFVSLPILIYATGMIIVFDIYVIGYEEVRLKEKYGDAFDEYRDSVSRWRWRRPSS